MSADESSLVGDGFGGEFHEQWARHLRQLWQEAKDAGGPGVPVEEVLDRLERKYLPPGGSNQAESAGGSREPRSHPLGANEEPPTNDPK